MTLSLYDITGIQQFVFSSNELAENLGASWLVNAASGEWLASAATRYGANVRWSGGGNAMVESPTAVAAGAVARSLSVKVHSEAPGLRIRCAHVEWDGAEASFRAAYAELQLKLRQHKESALPDATYDGAGVVHPADTWGELAVEYGQPEEQRPGKWRGLGAIARRAVAARARDAVQELFKLPPGFEWTTEIDKLGRSRGVQSTVGVIHFDGNGIGQRFQNAVETHGLPGLEALSTKVKEVGIATLRSALEWVGASVEGIQDGSRGGFELAGVSKKNRAKCFPVRPILFGGDDITVVCEGRIALDFAASLLKAWHFESRDLPGGSAHACAGVALVRSHYPFHRAYELAEDLCRNAKRWVSDPRFGGPYSCLDWQIFRGGGLRDLETMRNELRTKEDRSKSLTARPYVVVGESPGLGLHRRWAWFRDTLIDHLKTNSDFHTQYKASASVLADGPEAFRVHLKRWKDRFGEKFGLRGIGEELTSSGFFGNETPYLDALELMDEIVPAACLPQPEPAQTGAH